MGSIVNEMKNIPDMADFNMRDYFAMTFMNGYCSNMCGKPSHDIMESIAELAYEMADTILEVRSL